VDGPEGGCHGGSDREARRGWVLGVGDSKRSGAHTRESALGTEEVEGRAAGGGSGPWGAGIDLSWSTSLSLPPPLPPPSPKSPLDHGKRRADRVGKMSACVHTK